MQQLASNMRKNGCLCCKLILLKLEQRERERERERARD